VTDKPHKLAALRGLREKMMEFEKRRQACIELGDDPGEADRDAAQNALTAVVAFFLDFGIESEPLVRLLSELAALTEGSMPSTMLQPAATTHRRQDPPAIAGIKGRLAAVMEHRQNAGLSRKDAAAWVARRLPPRMRDRIGSVKPSTVDNWLCKWGGDRAVEQGSGREGYVSMSRILRDRACTESELEVIFDTLLRALPSGVAKPTANRSRRRSTVAGPSTAKRRRRR